MLSLVLLLAPAKRPDCISSRSRRNSGSISKLPDSVSKKRLRRKNVDKMGTYVRSQVNVDDVAKSTGTSGRAPVVLDEDEWTERIEAIIERDYFPDVPKLQNKLEWLQASQAQP